MFGTNQAYGNLQGDPVRLGPKFSLLRKKSVAFVIVSHFVFIYLKNNLRRISKPSAIVLARLGGRIAARHGVVVRGRALTPVLELTVVLRLLLCIDAVLVLLKIVVVAGRASGFTDLSVWIS